MAKMKFALNHKWKFMRWRYAYAAGLAQVIITCLVSIISFFVIIFETTVLDIVKDFLALLVISQLDDYFFAEYQESKEICKAVVKKEDYQGMLEVEVTTSKDAKRRLERDDHPDKFVLSKSVEWINFMRTQGSQKKAGKITPPTIHIDFWHREWFIEVPLYLIYRVIRVIFVSFWFYLIPFFAMSLQFLIPFNEILRNNKQDTESDMGGSLLI